MEKLNNIQNVETRQIKVPYKQGHVTGPASWERIVIDGDRTLRITNCPRNHDRYQARFTFAGKSFGKTWTIRKDYASAVWIKRILEVGQ